MSDAKVCSLVRNEPLRNSRSEAPVFVVGCPRSGTTLVYHMLLSAGNFAIYRAESQVFNLLEPRFGDLSIASHKRALLAAWYRSPLFTKTGLNDLNGHPKTGQRWSGQNRPTEKAGD
jgi:hypothetical protein